MHFEVGAFRYFACRFVQESVCPDKKWSQMHFMPVFSLNSFHYGNENYGNLSPVVFSYIQDRILTRELKLKLNTNTVYWGGGLPSNTHWTLLGPPQSSLMFFDGWMSPIYAFMKLEIFTNVTVYSWWAVSFSGFIHWFIHFYVIVFYSASLE